MYAVPFAVAATVWYLFQNIARTDFSVCTGCLVLSKWALLQDAQLRFHFVLDSPADPNTSGQTVWQTGGSTSYFGTTTALYSICVFMCRVPAVTLCCSLLHDSVFCMYVLYVCESSDGMPCHSTRKH